MEKDRNQDIVIEAGRNTARYWRDLWAYRELFFFLAWRDVLVRYKQTVVGVLWCVLKPVMTMIVFTVVFGKLAKLPSDGAPYPVLVFAALLPWQFFAGAITECSNSLVSNGNLLAKTYFPRLIVPASSVIVGLVDFFVSFLILLGLMAFYQFWPGWRIVALPLFLGLAFGCALGGGLLFAALNVTYRDFRVIVPFLVQFGLFVSPVGFSSSVVPQAWRPFYAANPMVAVIDGFRWSVTGTAPPPEPMSLALCCVVTAVLLCTGVWYFRRTERCFADVI
jgi:lipopolysaccharide transport system permease protein